MLWLLHASVWLLLLPDVACVGDLPFFLQANLVALPSAVLLAGCPGAFGLNDGCSHGRSRRKSSTTNRERKSVCSVWEQLGPSYGRRAHRMKEDSFWKLCRLLRPHLSGKKRKGWQEGCGVGAPNGIVPTPTKTSVALRWFAGGDACDIALNHSISHSQVFRCAWAVVDAINSCPELAFRFPASHTEQRKIARGFKEKSKAGFSICCGAIDGILIWMEKPSDVSCKQAKCGTSKFLCGRKKKFGLNMQGAADSHRRFLDMSMNHPAATSDFLAFSAMDLFHKLEQPGFLAPGLCLFGDNAHVTSQCMAVPCKNVRGGAKDDYNFYHSQVRITVECAFGMLAHRWGVLRKPLSAKISMKKVTALVMALCRLHNCCINCRIKPAGGTTPEPPPPSEPEDLDPLASDDLSTAINSGVDIVNNRPDELLGGGEHFDDNNNSKIYRLYN